MEAFGVPLVTGLLVEVRRLGALCVPVFALFLFLALAGKKVAFVLLVGPDSLANLCDFSLQVGCNVMSDVPS
jgi:hypothetical protein